MIKEGSIVAIIARMIQHIKAEAKMRLFNIRIYPVIGTLLFLSAFSLLQAQETEPEAVALMAGDSFGALFTKMLVVLACLLLVIYAASWALRRVNDVRWQSNQSSSSIQILERRMLHAKAGLYLIQVDNQKILAVESPNGIKVLGQWAISATKDSEN